MLVFRGVNRSCWSCNVYYMVVKLGFSPTWKMQKTKISQALGTVLNGQIKSFTYSTCSSKMSSLLLLIVVVFCCFATLHEAVRVHYLDLYFREKLRDSILGCITQWDWNNCSRNHQFELSSLRSTVFSQKVMIFVEFLFRWYLLSTWYE